jgi:DNA-binding YbaB/EbfC family protein
VSDGGELVPEQPGVQGIDLSSLLEQAQAMTASLMEAQAAAADVVHEGVSGGGAVRITVTGGMEFQSVTIRKDAVDPDDVEMLQDLVLAALHEAVAQVLDAQAAANPLSGMGGLGGLFGGGPDS